MSSHCDFAIFLSEWEGVWSDQGFVDLKTQAIFSRSSSEILVKHSQTPCWESCFPTLCLCVTSFFTIVVNVVFWWADTASSSQALWITLQGHPRALNDYWCNPYSPMGSSAKGHTMMRYVYGNEWRSYLIFAVIALALSSSTRVCASSSAATSWSTISAWRASSKGTESSTLFFTMERVAWL